MIDAYKSKLNRKLIARIYSCLQSHKGTSTLYIKSKWEKESKIIISEEDWLNICETHRSTSSSGQWREFVWKNMIWFFITPRIKQLQRGLPEYGHCWRECGDTQANHFHIFWECPTIRPYWLEIVGKINVILGFETKHDFCTMYLGNISSTINSSDKYLLKIMLAASKKCITRRWLNKEPPTKGEWIGTIKEMYHMERLTFSLNLCMDKFTNKCRKWSTHFETV